MSRRLLFHVQQKDWFIIILTGNDALFLFFPERINGSKPPPCVLFLCLQSFTLFMPSPWKSTWALIDVDIIHLNFWLKFFVSYPMLYLNTLFFSFSHLPQKRRMDPSCTYGILMVVSWCSDERMWRKLTAGQPSKSHPRRPSHITAIFRYLWSCYWRADQPLLQCYATFLCQPLFFSGREAASLILYSFISFSLVPSSFCLLFLRPSLGWGRAFLIPVRHSTDSVIACCRHWSYVSYNIGQLLW